MPTYRHVDVENCSAEEIVAKIKAAINVANAADHDAALLESLAEISCILQSMLQTRGLGSAYRAAVAAIMVAHAEVIATETAFEENLPTLQRLVDVAGEYGFRCGLANAQYGTKLEPAEVDSELTVGVGRPVVGEA